MRRKKNVKVDIKKEKKDKRKLSNNIIILFIVLVLLFVFILFRIAYIQFVKGDEYKETAYRNQTLNRIISPKRGTIYDASGKFLAISANVDTITINPGRIMVKNSDPAIQEAKTKELKELVAKGLSDIFELNYDEVLQKVNSTGPIETIIKKVEQDKVNELKDFMEKNKITTGINIDADTKRFYPYGNLASNLLGFCGTDNQGLEGLEARLNNVLTGTPGKIVSSADSVSQEIPNTNQLYIAEENGSDVVLSLDYTIQSIAEKYLKQAVEENNCTRGGNVIIMDPATGDVLAMATYPNYDLNTPFVINTESLRKNWDTLSPQERNDNLYKMWRNIAVSNGYEPGSTFKVLTAAIALEENLINTDSNKDFICTGSEKVGDATINCWRSSNPHGHQSLRMALQNSCNPSFIQLGQKIGIRTFYKYLDAFGLFNSTDANLSGEVSSNFLQEGKIGPVELATLSFGQRFTVTPLQLITAISSIANDGTLMQPRIVKQIINSTSNTTTDIPPVEVRQVLSSKTCEEMKSMLESVVVSGTGKYAAVNGYSIGGKTGTSEPPPGKKSEGYVASYVAISPIVDTKVAVLVTLYDPQGRSHEGGQIAAPVVSQILSEVLPYLGIASDYEATDKHDTLSIPDLKNKTVTEAIKTLDSMKLKYVSNTTGDKNQLLVVDQVPKPGTKVLSDAVIYLYTAENQGRTSVNVPNVKGMSLAQAKEKLKANNLNLSYEGSGTVISQDITAGTAVEPGTVIKLVLKGIIQDTY